VTRAHSIMSSPARSAIASSLASLVPGFLKRKRCAADEEQRKLRAALSAVDRTTLVDACIKLNEANEAHKQRLGELEQAVATLSGVVDSDIRTWSRDDLATYAPMQPAVVATAADAPAQPTGDMAAAGASIEVQTERDRLLSLQPVQAHREASFVFAVSSHEPEAAEWRKGDASYTSPGVGDPTLPADVFESLAFLNLRAMPIDVLWINFDGDDTRYRSSTVIFVRRCATHTTFALTHVVASTHRSSPAGCQFSPRSHVMHGAFTTLRAATSWALRWSGRCGVTCRQPTTTDARGASRCALCLASTVLWDLRFGTR